MTSHPSIKIGPLRLRPYRTKGKDTGKWSIDIPASITRSGKRKRKIYPNKSQAVDTAKRVKRELDMLALGIALTPHVAITFKELSHDWLVYQETRLTTRKKRASTHRSHVHRLKRLVQYFGSDDIAHITDEGVSHYQAKRLSENIQPSTVNLEVRQLRQLLRWAVRENKLPKMPVTEYVPEPRPRRNVPTASDVVALIDACAEPLNVLVQFVAETGVRSAEAFNLPWEHVDFDQNSLEIAAYNGWQPKTTSSWRTIYFGERLKAALAALPRNGPYVFAGEKSGKPRKHVYLQLRRAMLRAGLMEEGTGAPITLRSLRRAHATWLAMEMTPHQVIQARLGHTPGSRITDLHYAFATDAAQRANARDLISA